MTKPSIALHREIVRYVTSHPHIQHLTSRRDLSDGVYLQEIKCRFHQHNPRNNLVSRYSVDFIYVTQFDHYESGDDIRVNVIVSHSPLHIQIQGIDFY